MGLLHHSHGKNCSHSHQNLALKTDLSSTSSATQNIALALVVNLSFAIIELIGGIWTQSSAIQADAVHDFGDSAALGMALVLQMFSRGKPSSTYTYGLKRLSLVSAVATSILILSGSIFILVTASQKFQTPHMPNVQGMFWLAILGVCVNGFAAWRVGRGKSQNERAISWHMIEDLLGWVAVLLSSVIMFFVDIPWLDPLLAVVIAGMVLWGSARNLWSSFRLFLQATPAHVSDQAVVRTIEGVQGVRKIVSLQLWSLDGDHHVCSVKIQVSDNVSWQDWLRMREEIDRAISGIGKFELTVEPIP